ncbi:MAG: ABC transporter ATP-binding protein [Bacillota bacterium]
MLLQVRNLEVSFLQQGIEAPIVKEIDLSLEPGQTLALIGESGAGKTVTALAIMGLLSPLKTRIRGLICFEGIEISSLNSKDMAKIRGNKIGYIPQNSTSSLNPALPVGMQIIEGLLFHRKMSFAAARELCISLLEAIGVVRAEQFFSAYPHQLSGGMRQRALIAMALAMKPSLLIADELTSALDVTVQAEVLTILKRAQDSRELGILLITHDLAVAAQIAETVAIYYAGRIVEGGLLKRVFSSPRHPYTQLLLENTWRLEKPEAKGTHGTTRIIRASSPANGIEGCSFAPSCGLVVSKCLEAVPPFVPMGLEHGVACWQALSMKGDRNGE